jgi:hypothetical protein
MSIEPVVNFIDNVVYYVAGAFTDLFRYLFPAEVKNNATVPVHSWTHIKCKGCGKTGIIEKQCWDDGGIFSKRACDELNTSHTHHHCAECNASWITRIAE